MDNFCKMKDITFFISLRGKNLRDIFNNKDLKESLPEDLQRVSISWAGDYARVEAIISDDQEIILPYFRTGEKNKM